MLRWSSLLLLFILPACTMVQTTSAPVSDLGADYAKQQGYYTVSRGETLYFIAWRLDLDYQQLADNNGLQSPYKIHAGQKLLLSSSEVAPRPITKAIPAAATPEPVSMPVRQWLWPAQGHIEGKYSIYNKGVNIVGKAGSPIVASAGGQVVYAGNGLKAYGNLLIIKNNVTYLTAYAHNQKLLVREGDTVKQGQKIALMGSTGTQQTMLHFEIRKQGKPVNPLLYLPKL